MFREIYTKAGNAIDSLLISIWPRYKALISEYEAQEDELVEKGLLEERAKELDNRAHYLTEVVERYETDIERMRSEFLSQKGRMDLKKIREIQEMHPEELISRTAEKLVGLTKHQKRRISELCKGDIEDHVAMMAANFACRYLDGKESQAVMYCSPSGGIHGRSGLMDKMGYNVANTRALFNDNDNSIMLGLMSQGRDFEVTVDMKNHEDVRIRGISYTIGDNPIGYELYFDSLTEAAREPDISLRVLEKEDEDSQTA